MRCRTSRRSSTARPDGIVLPKARNGDDVRRLDHWLEVLEAAHGFARGRIGLIPLITESAGAVLSAATFARAAGPRRRHDLGRGGSRGRPRCARQQDGRRRVRAHRTRWRARSACSPPRRPACAAIDTVDTEMRTWRRSSVGRAHRDAPVSSASSRSIPRRLRRSMPRSCRRHEEIEWARTRARGVPRLAGPGCA